MQINRINTIAQEYKSLCAFFLSCSMPMNLYSYTLLWYILIGITTMPFVAPIPLSNVFI